MPSGWVHLMPLMNNWQKYGILRHFDGNGVLDYFHSVILKYFQHAYNGVFQPILTFKKTKFFSDKCDEIFLQ